MRRDNNENQFELQANSRGKAEDRRPKTETRIHSRIKPCSDFGFRPSFGLRVSAFGFQAQRLSPPPKNVTPYLRHFRRPRRPRSACRLLTLPRGGATKSST